MTMEKVQFCMGKYRLRTASKYNPARSMIIQFFLWCSSEIRARHRLKIVLMATEDDGGNMTVKKHWEFTNGYGRMTFRLSDDDLKEAGASKIKIMAEDSYGNILIVMLSV